MVLKKKRGQEKEKSSRDLDRNTGRLKCGWIEEGGVGQGEIEEIQPNGTD